MSESATVVFHRPPGRWFDRMRSYHILLDGEDRGTIKAGHDMTVEVNPGSHTARARIDWTGSPELAFASGAGERTDVRVMPAEHANIASSQKWLQLSVAPTDEPRD